MEMLLVLHEELEHGILLRLPVKSLLRFKCVSKSWYALIKSPTFVQLHLTRAMKADNENRSLVLRGPPDTEEHVITLLSRETLGMHVDLQLLHYRDRTFKPPLGIDLTILGSCNGIICLSDYDNDFALLNPATREFKAVPKPPESFSFHAHAYGFDPKSNDYMVVRIADVRVYGFDLNRVQVQIYTLSTNSWRTISALLPAFVVSEVDGWFDTYASMNGVYYWTAKKGHPEKHMILSFDISNQVFQATRMPINIPFNTIYTVSEVNGYVGVTIFDRSAEVKDIDIWVMKEFGVEESWTKLITIGPIPSTKPLGFWKNDEFLVQTCQSEIMSYHINTKEIKNFGVYSWSLMELATYVETLVSIKGSV